MNDTDTITARNISPIRAALPGLTLTSVIAAAAIAIHEMPGMGTVSPLILAIVIGIGLRNLFGLAGGSGTRHQGKPETGAARGHRPLGPGN